ncbi:hypothetical protein ACHQM5_024030 [Ranunculus cassubicifolius]
MDHISREMREISSDITPASPIMGLHSQCTCSSPTSSSAHNNSILPVIIQDTGRDLPKDAWLPITASRNGNSYYAAFHAINSGIGFQALLLPVAFSILGWTWGIICLSLLFVWQFYTIWLMVQLHEAMPGTRYNRYLQISMAAFGEKLGKLLVLFPIMYLSGASCVMLIMFAADSMMLFVKTTDSQSLSTLACQLIFVSLAVILSLFHPNLNSIAWISSVGASTAVLYCTLIWVVSVNKIRQNDISYDPVLHESVTASAFSVFNAMGIVALAFRGHNLILEIQATMPSNEKYPSRVPMSRGMNFAYLLISLCMFPLAFGGYWAYGNKIETYGDLLKAVQQTSTSIYGIRLITLLVVIHCLCSFQIYAMPTLDNWTFVYISKKKKPCPRLIGIVFRVLLGCLTFFIAVAVPFIRSLAGLIGGIVLPLTFAYPCFMWIAIKKPQRWGVMWCANLVVGSLGMIVSVLVFAGGIWGLVNPGIDVRFFKP